MPLLRAWLRRRRKDAVRFHVRHRWLGWDAHGRLQFLTPAGEQSVVADAVILALGEGSWPKLGSDASWVPILNQRRVPIAPLQPSNGGFNVTWTDHFKTKFAGHSVKSVGVVAKTVDDLVIRRRGDFVITESGVEGGVIYAVSAGLRDVIAAKGVATLRLDLAPDREVPRLIKDLSRPRGKHTMATQLERRAGIAGVKAGLLRSARLSRETQEKAKDLVRQQDAQIKQLNLERKRKAMEAQIADIRAEFRTEEGELKKSIKQEKLRQRKVSQDRKAMAKIRKAD